MENRRPISYTFEDIKRYRQGLMNREEMHAFEKASMEDPFLADALEGYMEADMVLAEEHLGKIKISISEAKEEKEKAVVVPMPQKRYAFMRVAAMIIVIAGAGLLTYKIFDKKDPVDSQPMAKNEQPAINEIKPGEKPQAAAPSVDNRSLKTNDGSTVSVPDKTSTYHSSDKNTGNIATERSELGDISEPKTLGEAASVKSSAEKQKEETNKAAKDPLPTLKGTAADYDVTTKTNSNSNFYSQNGTAYQNNQIRGRVLTPNNQPLANANIQLDNSRKPIVTDDQGNFELNSKDSIVTATVASSGFMNTRVELRSNAQNTINIGNIVLQTDPTVENTLAVTGLGTEKKKVRTADTLTSKPEGGWESFQQYVAGKLNTKLDTTGRNMRVTGSGELELEFFVDANGIPKDFKIINSTDPALNNKAIEAVKQGPKWATRKKKARILIRY